MTQPLWSHLSRMHDIAITHYNAKFGAGLFEQATRGMTKKYTDGLISDAMALSGSPFYGINPREYWSYDAQQFLLPFAQEHNRRNAPAKLVDTRAEYAEKETE